jgi:mono/diheme cytochrome c family protein
MIRHVQFGMFNAVLVALVGLTGCQQKMAKQPSYQPDDACAFFSDGTSSRHPVSGTVARGHLKIDTALYTGRLAAPESAQASTVRPIEGDLGAAEVLAAEASRFQGVVDEFPFPLSRELIEHGRNRYLIYCVVCHDSAGTGHGKIVERGYTRPPSYHTDRLREVPVGHIFRVVTHGYGSMPSYATQISPRDRWAIVAYVRALQLSQHFSADKLPAEMRQEWEENQRIAADGGAP